ncbi:MAG: RusA family crossover junction endodeoxyribonuclease [Halothece sp.]
MTQQTKLWKFQISGKVVPKARPRFNGKTSYLPSNYRQWKEDAKTQLASQSIPDEPLEEVSVSITLSGKHSRRGDLDNLAGSILDALVASQIIRDDNLKCVSGLSVQLNYSAKDDPTAQITIE